MKRKWSLRLGAAVLCAVLLGSCGSTAAAPAESTAPADPLTGQQLLYPEQRAAAVVIENTTDSTTQWGIGSASVVLEAMTESGSSTELCLVYPALSAMPVVGPVTRGQDLYWRLLSGQQVLPIQCGSSAYAKRYLEYYNLRAVDAQEVGRNAFVSTGYSWDNTPLWRTSGKAVASVLDSLSISTAVNQNTTSGSESETAGVLPTLLPQRDTGHLPDANAADAVKATVNFQSGGATGFVYDDALAAYGMLHADGTPQLDANTGTQAVFDNLLILYSGSSLRDDGRTLDYDLSMGGGVWLNGGHLWQVTWTQGTQSTLALYDSNGKPLNLPAGRSYIALLSSLTGQELLVQSSTGEALVGQLRPAAVVCVDSLCSAEGQRLGRTVQFSDSGLYPAQADHTRHLTRDTLGVPVVAAGIPTLMQAQEGADLVVTPRALDSVIAHGAALLAGSVNRALQPRLTVQQLCWLTG